MIRNYTIIIITFFLICCLKSGYTQPVSSERAKKVAEKVFFIKARQLHLATDKLHSNEVIIKQISSHILYYVINFEEGGFILISADERFFPVLAYSFQGRFSLNDIPENCQDWLNLYESQIYDALQNEGPFFSDMKAVWSKYDQDGIESDSINMMLPLVTCTWAQDGFYNQMCPAEQDGYNGHVPVGCVAVAMAQLMYYYRFPDSGNGTMLYTPGYQGGIYGQQYVDFSASTYAWSTMTDICREPNDAIAQICYHAGVALQTSYMPQSSGASIEDVPEALVNHFYYQSDHFLPRIEVQNSQEWVTMLINNLAKRQPVLYKSHCGFVGHVYICDGYQDSTHFHFNWGWGGAYNGYYYIDDLTPGGINLNSDQGAIFNIFPDTNQIQYPGYGSDTSILINDIGSFEDGSGPFNYLAGEKQSWLISPEKPEITNILLEFSMIDTEVDVDMIKVYDGDSEEAPLIASLSGNNFPISLNSSGPALFVTFKTNDQNQSDGFHASYYGYHLPFCSGTQLLTDPTGILGDGSRYHNYLNGTDCEWIISPYLSPLDSVAKVSLYFSRFNLADGDTVFIYDGPDKASLLLGKFSKENNPGSIDASGNVVLVNFITDQEKTAKGWDLGWNYILPEYCNDTMYYYTSEAVLSDGSGKKNYVENTDCFYVIDVPETQIIKIEFLEFNLETDYDYLKFYNLENPDIPLFKFTGHELPDVLSFPFNKLLVHFHSDYRDNFSGWKFSYNTSSSAITEFNEDIVLSPNPVYSKLKIEIDNFASFAPICSFYTMEGVMVFSGKISSSPQIIDLKFLQAGMYLIVVEYGSKKFHHKILKF
jgi:hypothetical protein